MLQLKKCPPFEAMILLTHDPQGVESLYTVVKGTFVIGEQVVLAAKQLPVEAADKYYGDPGASSVRVPGDLGLIKPGTDVMLAGHAYAPGGQPVKQMEITLSVGAAIRKTVHAWGDRFWSKGMLGAKMSDPVPFTKMPLVWERAFGGSDMTVDEPPKVEMADRNPVGAGFHMKHGKKELEGLKLPNLESPPKLIRSWTDRPEPAAFAPIGPHWQPRKSYAGTYDDAWQKTRSPFLPTDFDSRFFQLAPPDQVVPAYLQGGEAVEVCGATPGGRLRFRLPQLKFEVIYHLDDAQKPRPANLDTVLIEPDESRLVLLWRTVFPCDKKALQVREIEVTAKSTR
jgi:hypothetical protein